MRGRALAHVAAAAALLAKRSKTAPEGMVRLQVTRRYVQHGANVGQRSAASALRLFRRATGGDPSEVGSHGWFNLSHDALEGVWRFIEALADEGDLPDPEIEPGRSEVFAEGVPCRRSSFRCPCEAHANGDRNPSGYFCASKGFALCMVTREAFQAKRCREGRITLYRWTRLSEGRVSPGGCSKKRIPGRSGSLSPAGPARDAAPPVLPAVVREAREAGDPDLDRVDPGMAAGTLGPWGIKFRGSSSSSWGSLLRWHARRWSGPAGREDAWREAVRQQLDPEARPGRHLGDRLVRVGHCVPVFRRWAGTGLRFWPEFEVPEHGTSRVLFDLDDVGGLGLTEEAEGRLVEAVRWAVESCPMFREVQSIVRTSGRGLQVVAELAAFRRSVEGFYRDAAVRSVLRAVGEAILDAVQEVTGSPRRGHVDEAVWRSRATARLPGWRVRDGVPVLARLLWAIGS